MKKITLSTFIVCGMASTGFSQNVGISEAAPNSKLDVVQTETTGNSIEVSHAITTSTADAVFIKNNGLGIGLNVWNQLTTNADPVGLFDQRGTGDGIVSIMPVGNASAGIFALHQGTGVGIQNSQIGTGLGIYNDVTDFGQYNLINANGIAIYNDLTTAGGIGSYVDLDVQDGFGVSVNGTNAGNTVGGDVIGLSAFVRTATPTVGTNVSGAALAGEQYGVGHGILITHSGVSGRNAEFNIEGTANTDPAIFSAHSGQGSVIVGQNQSNAIAGTISVADFSYTGSDVDDHIGVEGSSVPADGFGVGILGTGGYFGVVGQAGSPSAVAGVFAVGDVAASGAKPFIIDHPSDPANKMLRHFAIESDEVLNVYRGNIMLDANGKAIVELPEYFDVINIDFSYQLTAIGTPVHPYVLTEVEGNSFEVAGEPNTKVSWMLMAQRNDPYLQQNPHKKENIIEKEGERKGKYLTPELYNQPESKGMFYTEANQDTAPSSLDKSKLDEMQKKIEKSRKEGERTKVERPVSNE